jgi:hypothetical protein
VEIAKGRIGIALTVWCGYPDCYRWRFLQSNRLRGAEREARDAGWRLSRRYGWVCDHHAGPRLKIANPPA